MQRINETGRKTDVEGKIPPVKTHFEKCLHCHGLGGTITLEYKEQVVGALEVALRPLLEFDLENRATSAARIDELEKELAKLKDKT